MQTFPNILVNSEKLDLNALFGRFVPKISDFHMPLGYLAVMLLANQKLEYQI